MSSEDQGIFVTTQPTAFPAKCARCSSSKYDGRRYVDFGVDQELPPMVEPGVTPPNQERNGVVFLCSLCLAEIYNAVFPDEGAPVAEWENERADLLQKVELQHSIMKTMEAQLNDLRNSNSSNSSSDSDDSAPVSYDETASYATESNGPEQGTAEPDSKPRYKDVPSLTELLKANS